MKGLNITGTSLEEEEENESTSSIDKWTIFVGFAMYVDLIRVS
jgi:hypothetical protein